jgi:hypothetical protein
VKLLQNVVLVAEQWQQVEEEQRIQVRQVSWGEMYERYESVIALVCQMWVSQHTHVTSARCSWTSCSKKPILFIKQRF